MQTVAKKSKNNVFLVFATVFYPRTYVYGALFYGIYDSGNECKTKKIHKKIYGVRHKRVYSREYRECAGLEGADEEHIEFLLRHCIVHYRIEQQGYYGKSGENYHRPGKEAFAEMMAVMCHKEDADSKLNAVVNHCLYVYTYSICENVAGVYHYYKAGK